MDLSDLIPKSDTITVTLRHPITGEVIKKDDGSEMTITVYGQHTEAYKSAIHEQMDKRIERAAKNKDTKVSAAEMDNTSAELLAKTTVDWNLQFNKKDHKFTVANAVSLYKDPKLAWIKNQVLAEQENFEAFLKA